MDAAEMVQSGMYENIADVCQRISALNLGKNYFVRTTYKSNEISGYCIMEKESNLLLATVLRKNEKLELRWEPDTPDVNKKQFVQIVGRAYGQKLPKVLQKVLDWLHIGYQMHIIYHSDEVEKLEKFHRMVLKQSKSISLTSEQITSFKRELNQELAKKKRHDVANSLRQK